MYFAAKLINNGIKIIINKYNNIVSIFAYNFYSPGFSIIFKLKIAFKSQYKTKSSTTFDFLITFKIILLGSEKLSFLANRDKLTGLYNRGYILKYLYEKENANEMYSIVIIDLDKFKHYNDTYGHNIGDHVLKNACKSMKEALKKIEFKSVLARYGGEEFIICFDIDNKKELYDSMEIIREHLAKTDFSTDEYSLKATASLGGAVKQKQMNLSEFINKADQSLYNAKETGRNKSVIL